MISIQTYIPANLSGLIKSFWYMKIPSDLSKSYIEEILPDGHHEIIFHVNAAPSRKRKNDENWYVDPDVLFTGQSKKSYALEMHPGSVMYAIRFQTHTQTLFYDFPASLSTDKIIALSDVDGKDALLNCIEESPEKTFANFERELMKRATRLISNNNSFLYVDAAVRNIIHRNGNVKVEFLEKVTGVSSRQLDKHFQKYVGLSPKQFSNTIRYNHFVNYRKNNPQNTLAQCAYEAGFHDQSHLIHLSQLITGQSPKAYFKNQNYINNHFLEA